MPASRSNASRRHGARKSRQSGQRPAGAPQPLDGIAVVERRAPAERAAQPLGRRLELRLDPPVERAAIERLGLRLGQDLEARVDQRLHRPLVQEVVAEAVDGADARFFQVGDGVVRAARAVPARRASHAPVLQRLRAAGASARRPPSR